MNLILALPRRLFYGLSFLVFFTRELVIANLRVAWEIVTPGLRLSPAIVRVPIECRTEWEIMLLANAVTMTPGTLSLEVDTTDNALFVHSLYVTDRTEFVASIHQMEHMLLRAMRGSSLAATPTGPGRSQPTGPGRSQPTGPGRSQPTGPGRSQPTGPESPR